MEKETTPKYDRFNLEVLSKPTASGFDMGSTEDNEMLGEIKELNENIKGLKGAVASLSELLNYLTKENERLSEEQELMKMDLIYEKYGKPLEKDHKREFACITPEGDYVLGKTSVDAEKKAEEEGLEDFILFQIGNPGGGIDI